MRLSRYIVAQMEDDDVAIWSTKSGQIISVSSADWARLQQGDMGRIASHLLSDLEAGGFLVDSPAHECAAILDENDSACEVDDQLNIVFVPSGNCPLGCNMQKFGGYCGQSHDKTSMSAELATKAVKLIETSLKPQHQRLMINWFGGEPLMAMDRMVSVSASLSSLCATRDIAYTATVTTGGTLMTHLVAHRLTHQCSVRSVNVTLDGLSEAHDLRRPTKAGRSTFGIIVNNLRAIIEDENLSKLSIAVRCNVDRRNLSAPRDLIEYFADLGWQNRIDLYFASVHPWGEAHNRDYGVGAKEFAENEIRWFELMIAKGYRPSLITSRRKIVCRVVSPSRFVIGHDGHLHKCAETPLTRVNLATDTLATLDELSDATTLPSWRWHDQVRNGEAHCSTCVHLPSCGGACPLSWNSGSDIPCPPFKFNAEDRLRLHRSAARSVAKELDSQTAGDGYITLLRRLASVSGDKTAIDHFGEALSTQRTTAKWGNIPRESHAIDIPPFFDRRMRHVARAAALASEAYVAYRERNLKQLIELSEAAIQALHLADIDGSIDVRPLQLQIALNLLGAQLKLFGSYDTTLFGAVWQYLTGDHSLRIGSAFVRRLDDINSLGAVAAKTTLQTIGNVAKTLGLCAA